MLQFYKPNPVVIPEDSPVQKRFPRLYEIPSGEETKVDTATLFYDIFLDPSTNRLIGLGPALSESEEGLISYVGNLSR